MKQFYTLFVLFSTVFCYSQVSLVSGVDEKEFKVNKKFTVTFIYEVSGENLEQQTPLRLPDFSKFNVIASGSDRNTVILDRGAVYQIIYQWVISPKVVGDIRIGSATVTVNGKIYKTEPIDITVSEADKTALTDSPNKLRNDLYLNVEVADKEVYENQPTIAVLKAYSRNLNNFRKVKNVKLPTQEIVQYTPISNKKSEIETENNNFSSQTLAVFLIYPNKSGRVELKPISANYSNNKEELLSNKVKITVKELPKHAPENFKNAVGNFAVNFTNKGSEKVEIDEPLNMRITISGNGNLENLQLPTIEKSDAYQIFAPKITRETKIEKSGIVGSIFADYIIIPKKAGMISIATDAFSYFNPEKEEYVDLGTQKIDFNVVSHDEILSARSPLERVNEYTNNVLQSVSNPVLPTEKLQVKAKNDIDWKTSAINFVLFFSIIGILILINNRQKNRKKIANNALLNFVDKKDNEDENSGKVSLDDTFGYMNRMLRENNFDEFFSSLSFLDKYIKKQYIAPRNSNFFQNLEREKGSKIVEDYRALTQKIEIEKYAPIKNEDQINELLPSIKNIYSIIAK